MPIKKKPYHHRNLRQTLVEAAIPLLAEHGVSGLSWRGVARAAGVSHTAPYRHFRNKADLLEAIAAQGYSQLEAGCAQAEARFADDPQRQFTEAGMAYLFFVIEQPAIAQLMFSGTLSPSSRGEDLQAAARAAIAALERIIENGKQAGIYLDRSTNELVLSALACVHGLAMMISAGLIVDAHWTRPKLRRLGDLVASTLLQGMLKK
jgi:AcrR family transcriptional regulator